MSRIVIPTAICLCALSASIASLPAHTQQPTQPATITGMVRLPNGSAPAQGAFVSVELQSIPNPVIAKGPDGELFLPLATPDELPHTQTDKDGHFVLSGIPPGTYYLDTYLPGTINSHLYAYQGARPLDPESAAKILHKVMLAPGQTQNVDVQLLRGGSIEGRVLAADGTPSFNAKSVFQPFPGTGVHLAFKDKAAKYFIDGGTALTEADGHYRIDGIAPGAYLVVSGTGSSKWVEVPTGGKIGGCAGGTSIFAAPNASTGVFRPEQALVVDIAEGSNVTGIDIVLPTGKLNSVAGRVELPDGKPLGSASVRLQFVGDDLSGCQTPLPADGTFSFSQIPDGTYTLTFTSEVSPDFLGFTPDNKALRYRATRNPYKQASLTITLPDPAATNLILKPELDR